MYYRVGARPFTMGLVSSLEGPVKKHTHKVPQSPKYWNVCLLAALHDLRVSGVVGGNEDDWMFGWSECEHPMDEWIITFRIPVCVSLLYNLHGVWAPASRFTIPEKQSLGTNILVDQITDCGSERLLLLRTFQRSISIGPLTKRVMHTNPDEIPISGSEHKLDCG